MRTDTCANCGQTIYLVKKSANLFRWVTDPEKPDETVRCSVQPGEFPPEKRHAPVSAQEAHR